MIKPKKKGEWTVKWFKKEIGPEVKTKQTKNWLQDWADYQIDLHMFFVQIRLVRTAGEWGSSYRFWSCADIDIVTKGALKEDQICSNHGKHNKEKGG